MVCGQTLLGDTGGQSNALASYACSSGARDGGEVVYRFLPLEDDTIQVALEYDVIEASLDAFVLDGACTGASCTAHGDSLSSIGVEANVPVFVVVDGPAWGSGTFRLRVECASAGRLGCWMGAAPGCGGCTCEACVCASNPACCSTSWSSSCVDACQAECGGCGSSLACGDGTCDAGETCATCEADCTCGAQHVCDHGVCCAPDCGGAVCGDDGCGGSCGTCVPGQRCVNGACKPIPCPISATVACGQSVEVSGAGQSELSQYACTALDYPGKELLLKHVATTDGVLVWNVTAANHAVALLGLTDVCDPLNACSTASATGSLPTLSVPVEAGSTSYLVADSLLPYAQTTLGITLTCCTPDCTGKDCGDDGCGTTCGTCADGTACSTDGSCVPHVACEGSPLTCGSVVTGDTQTSLDGLHGYSCGQDADTTGPELGYALQVASDDLVTVTLQPTGVGSPTLYALSGACEAQACVARSDSFFVLDVQAGQPLWLVVDSAANAGGPFQLSVTCQSQCVPDCAGKLCGDDGCGGSCGACAGNCYEGICHAGTGCKALTGSGCNGCGCEACVCALEPSCCEWAWDAECAAMCIQDCGGCPILDDCGDGQCEAPEDCSNCSVDCACAAGMVCTQGACCTPSCGDAECGDDGCGGVCGECPAGLSCTVDGVCQPPVCKQEATLSCNDVVDGEMFASATPLSVYGCVEGACPGPEVLFGLDPQGYSRVRLRVSSVFDAVLVVMEETCSPGVGCVAGVDAVTGAGVEMLNLDEPSSSLLLALDARSAQATGTYTITMLCCDPSCIGADCGDDGCGSVCGTCASGFDCHQGLCIPPCTGSCVDRECGNDGCGGSCGECAVGLTCNPAGICTDGTCVPDCQARECGPNGCGGSCGECAAGQACTDGACTCVPACDARECGDDGCGGSCGDCSTGWTCSASGICVEAPCQPDCAGKACGPDGCGGSCGDCDAGFVCKQGACAAPCQPDCSQTECGPDPVCSELCGTCTGGDLCVGGRCRVPGYDDDVRDATTSDAGGEDGGGGGGGCALGLEPEGAGRSGAALVLLGALLGLVARRRPGTRGLRRVASMGLACALTLSACFDSKVDRTELPCTVGLGDPCYTGITGTAGVGVCRAGTTMCWEEAEHFFQRCEWQVIPSAEVCDGQDNDCDGVPDDDAACFSEALTRFEATVGPVDEIAPRGQGTPPRTVVGARWRQLFSCEADPSVFGCVQRFLQEGAGFLGVEDPMSELEFSHEIAIGPNVTALAFRQIWRNRPVEGGSVVVQVVGGHVFAVESTVRPVRRNLRADPIIDEDDARASLPQAEAVSKAELVWTHRALDCGPGASGEAALADAGEALEAEPTIDLGPAPLALQPDDMWLAYRFTVRRSLAESLVVYVAADDASRTVVIPRTQAFPTFSVDGQQAVPLDAGGQPPPISDWMAEAQRYASWVGTVAFDVNAVDTNLITDTRLADTDGVALYVRADLLDPAAAPTLGSPGAAGCAGACGWHAGGTGRVFLCDLEAKPECDEATLPHELSHALFDPYVAPVDSLSSGAAAFHAVVDWHARLFLCADSGLAPKDCAWGSLDDQSTEGTAPDGFDLAFGRALVRATRAWSERIDQPLPALQSLLYSALLMRPSPTRDGALVPFDTRDDVSAWLVAACEVNVQAGDAPFDERACVDLMQALHDFGCFDPCAAPVAGEHCNGADDNCDGLVDNCVEACPDPAEQTRPFTLRRPYYTGPENSQHYGLCREGREICASTGWTVDVSEIVPATCGGTEACDTCDGADNDCDGQIDQGCACRVDVFTPRPCGEHKSDDPWCRAGVQVCQAAGRADPADGTLVCKGSADVNVELCDGLDNDCDGPIDEAPIVGVQEACVAEATGGCTAGSTACISGQMVCLPGAPTAVDGCGPVDANCDGVLHDDWLDQDKDGFFVDPGYACPDRRWDCNDQVAAVHPGAMLPCGFSEDNDCDDAPDVPGVQCICQPACDGRNCGPDGCGGTCGACTMPGEVCDSVGHCVCSQTCGSKVCGFDACGHSCGSCPSGQVCRADGSGCCDRRGNCENRCCGSDGCGGTCPMTCDDCMCAGAPSFGCVCIPKCGGKSCGDDSCGGSCGTCPPNMTCNAEGLCAP